MPIYECDRCKKQFSRKNNYISHQNKKIKCEIKQLDDAVIESTEIDNDKKDNCEVKKNDNIENDGIHDELTKIKDEMNAIKEKMAEMEKENKFYKLMLYLKLQESE